MSLGSRSRTYIVSVEPYFCHTRARLNIRYTHIHTHTLSLTLSRMQHNRADNTTQNTDRLPWQCTSVRTKRSEPYEVSRNSLENAASRKHFLRPRNLAKHECLERPWANPNTFSRGVSKTSVLETPRTVKKQGGVRQEIAARALTHFGWHAWPGIFGLL